MFLLSIYDSAAKFYLPVFTVENLGQALREFSDACNNKESFLGKHPADYTLFCLGSFEQEKGIINPYHAPERLGCGIDYVKSTSGIDPNPRGIHSIDVN